MIKIYQDLLLKNGLKSMINQEEIAMLIKKLESKKSMLRSDLCDYSDAYIVIKGTITVDKKQLLLMILKHPIIQQLMQQLLILQMIMGLVKKSWFLKTMLHLSIAL